jgi:hypothetical protein
MWSASLDQKYDEKGKPITIFDEHPELMTTPNTVVTIVPVDTAPEVKK